MGAFERLAAAIARALHPLTIAVQSDDGVRQLTARLGWTLPLVPPSLRALADPLVPLHTSLGALSVARANRELGGGQTSEVDSALSDVAANLLLTAAQLHDLPVRLRAELPAAFVAETQIDVEFESRLLDWLISIDMDAHAPVLYRVLRVAGVIETREEITPEAERPVIEQYSIRWDRLLRLVDPAALVSEVYGWGTPALDLDRLFRELVPLSFALGIPAELRYASPAFTARTAPAADPAALPESQLWVPVLRTDTFTLFVVASALAGTSASEPAGLILALVPSASGDLTIPFGPGTQLTIAATATVGTGAAIVLRPGQDPTALLDMEAAGGGEMTTGRVSATLAWRAEEWERAGDPNASDGTGVTARDLSIGFGVEAAGGDVDVFVDAGVDEGRLVIAPPSDDGLLASVIPEDGVNVPFSIGVRWSRDGLRFRGSAALSTTLPLHRTLGPLTLQSMDLAIGSADGALAATATVTVALAVGPFTFLLQGMGLGANLRATPGNLGPVDVAIGFARPTGIGVSVDAGMVSGGGLIRYEPATGRYSGTLQLTIGEIGVGALGILDTRLPGGGAGYALLVALRATFPGIQIGFGFALTSVGGLLALNRRVDVDVLRAQLASGIAGRLLRPEDPVRDAPALLADLAAAFPVAVGSTVVGPTVQVVWARLVDFDIAVLLQLPGPSRVVLLGSARAAIAGGGKIYLQIRVDILGVIDLQQRLAAFDAVLVGSQLLEILELTGGAAFRLSWGEQPYAVLTLGGFHPAYHPEPLVLPPGLTRIAMVRGTPKDELYLRFEGYFAVTTNTLQFGAAVDATIRSGSFNIQGIVGFDALIRFQPFHFQIDIRASVRVRYKSRNLAGLTLTGSLEGPGPVVLRARVCIELLFFDICFSDTYTLGSAAPPPVTTIANALDVMIAELEDPTRLQAGAAADRHVTLRALSPGSLPVVTPAGHLVWVQHQAPLGLLLQRIGGAPLATAQSVEASSTNASAELDWFAPGSFADLTDDQALNRPAFERLTGGLRFGGSATLKGPEQARTLTIRQIRLPARVRTLHPVVAFPAFVVERGQSGRPPRRPGKAIAVGEENWSVVAPGTETLMGLSAAQAHQLVAFADVKARRAAVVAGDELSTAVFEEI
jgi:hypothetical protein